jgi:hypothetical protein
MVDRRWPVPMASNESPQFASHVPRHVRWLHCLDQHTPLPEVLEKLIGYGEIALNDPRSIACLREMFLELRKQRAALRWVV